MPWCRVNDPVRAAGIPAAAAVCSRDANAGSCRAAPRPATAAPRAGRLHVAGAAGWPLDVTAPPATADSAAATRPDAIGAGSASDPLSRNPITPPPRSSRRRQPAEPSLPPPIHPVSSLTTAWASARAKSPKKPRAGLATGPAAMSSSSPRRGLPIGDSARAPAVGLYDASDSVRPGSAAGDGGASRRDDAPIAVRLDTTRSCRHVLSRPHPDSIVPLPPKTEEGAGGPDRCGRGPSLPDSHRR